ncbi:monooxygenase 2 [Dendrobium catenatum]|uniref:Zeaxanthin epoxidase, chloroplastic n=1 Tax=Dendrobium catenatum TaxID=906689 RepID=A0A2I0W3U0_9ASPA|nr:monooxygenase 2 [Dendrobium catenatum]PKU70322.1 Zeaxanthin epoxidase, chloroplastic [Dendrobium catenatum]
MAVEEIVIVGGGIAGVATALALRRVGKKSLVLERWRELRETGSALTLSHNAWCALDALGVGHKLKPHYRLLRTGTVTNLATGATQTQSFPNEDDDGREEMGSRSVHRTALLEAMAEELPPDSIRFCSKLVSIRTEALPDSSTIMVLHLDDGAIIKAKAVIGCDGVHSVVAQWLGLASPRDSGRSAVRGLAVYPEGHNFRPGLQQFLLNEVRAGFVPINDKDVYWFVTHPTTPKVSEMGRDPELIRRATLEHLIVDLPAEFKVFAQQSEPSSLSWNQFLYRLPWDVLFGQLQRGCVTVAGDAFHPTTPDLGQGACVALEDTVVLARCLAHANSPKDMEQGMARYAAERRWRATWLIIASYISGFVQQGSDGRWTSAAVKLFRDLFFYRFVFPWIIRIARYDCGKLPEV